MDDNNESTFASFNLNSMAGLHVAVAMTRTLPFMKDIGTEDQVLISTVVSELGTNILKFAGKGTISLARIFDSGHDAIQIIAQDNGAGIRDVQRAMQDGYSSAGTLGLGLPAVSRIMSTMKIETVVGKGTRVVTCKWLNDGSVSGRSGASGRQSHSKTTGVMKIEYAQEVRPHPRETVSGDMTILCPVDAGLLFGIIDVSGHGPEAHLLAQKFGQAVITATSVDIEHLLRLLHAMATGTRGAAVGLAFFDCVSHRLAFAGIGNVHIRVIGGRSWRGVSRDGIVGERLPGILAQTVGLTPGDLVVIASDGVSESARTNVLVRGSTLSAGQIAKELILQAGKMTDDASCVVVKCLR
ncbi:MAG: SpoIIE family protein phosphatase [Candidatus Magnetobacterium sp. LHC-1]|uniref:SpoIIE family protein phosphatase n=1 Tax=Candidatus Magnetobacterium casense TaxID=1455061 RepID=A0ABS6RWF2_9BACT|nr:SpoIIE family protein phosphatase [Candidatus Magnetobacterium casensis]MBF0606923.1 SpoIIE family protein phosphatase [Nitrospirota bacterium]MBV6340964.1 SpoIIE family protein phosphatase [Candidatus Magnetobacterium casensis]